MKLYLSAVWGKKLMPVAKYEQYMHTKPEEAKRYLEIEQSTLLGEYLKLDALMHSTAYNENEKNAKRLKKLSTNKYVTKYLQAETQSEEEKEKWEGRSEVIEYTSLKGKVADYSHETARYNELKKHADIVFYLSHDKEEMHRMAKPQLLLTDELNGNILTKGWKVGYHYNAEALKNVYSYPNELQVYTSGKNIEIIDGILNMKVRKEKANGSVWDAKKGMISREAEFTADMLHTDEIAIEPGMMIQAKVLAKGKCVNAINLQDAKHEQIVTIFHQAGKDMKCGVKGNLKDVERILGLPFAVYTLYWGKDNLVWYINDMEVCRMPNTLKAEKMYIHMYQQVTEAHRGQGVMKVDWVKAYKVVEG